MGYDLLGHITVVPDPKASHVSQWFLVVASYHHPIILLSKCSMHMVIGIVLGLCQLAH